MEGTLSNFLNARLRNLMGKEGFKKQEVGGSYYSGSGVGSLRKFLQ